MSYLKASIDGVNGSGKSGTAARMAVAISVEQFNRAPVVVYDAEERWRFIKRNIFDVEKVPLIIVSGQSLPSLHQAIDRAKAENACVFVGDQLTTPWLEGLASFSYENGALPFDRRAQLMQIWDEFVKKFRYGKFHSICCGRLGYHWQNVEDESGALTLIQGDAKFNAGGGNNFGYEADLELEVRRRKRLLAGIFRGKVTVEHLVDVVKDVTETLKGGQFQFLESAGPYKRGDYKAVFDAIKPHLDYLNFTEPIAESTASSRDLVVSGRTDWSRDQLVRKGQLEELAANLDMAFPGGEGKSKVAKMLRDLTLEFLNGFISWSRMEEETKTDDLERNVLIVKALRKRIQAGECPTGEGELLQLSLKTLLNLSTEDVLHPGRNITLLEAMGKKSMERVA